ncbi:MAG: LamG domain-containing protein [Myxococcota bacterium]|nr:LamG domain-containing protein [Myxococcota bacterium]
MKTAAWAICALVPACTFATELPEEAPGLDPGTVPTPTASRCQTSGLTLCVDFEDMPNPTDGIASAATITSSNLVPQLRFTAESAAQLQLDPLSLVTVGEVGKLDIASTLTIEMWTKPAVRPPDSGDKQVGLFDNHLQYAMNFEADGDLECTINGDSLDSDVSLATNAWHHVACTYDGSQLRVYVDGKLQGCEPISATISNQGTFGSAIGANLDNGPTYKNRFVGQLDNVHVYGRALSAAEICTLWGNGNCDDQCPATSKGGRGGGYGGWGDD